MRAIFDVMKEAVIAADRFWLNNMGSEIFVAENACPVTKIYGFYDWQESGSLYGINANNGMLIEVSMADAATFNNFINKYFIIEGVTWRIVNRYFKRNRFLGTHRLLLICEKFQKASHTEGIKLWTKN